MPRKARPHTPQVLREKIINAVRVLERGGGRPYAVAGEASKELVLALREYLPVFLVEMPEAVLGEWLRFEWKEDERVVEYSLEKVGIAFLQKKLSPVVEPKKAVSGMPTMQDLAHIDGFTQAKRQGADHLVLRLRPDQAELDHLDGMIAEFKSRWRGRIPDIDRLTVRWSAPEAGYVYSLNVEGS